MTLRAFTAKTRENAIFLLIITALFIGCVNIIPHLTLERELESRGEAYYPYTIEAYFDMTNVVGPRIREVLDGQLVLSDIDVFEYQDAPAFWPMGAETYFAPFGLFTNSIVTVVFLSDFIFPALFFLLLFTLFYLLSERHFLLSYLGALLVSLYHPIAIHLPPPNLYFVGVIWDTIMPFTDNPDSHFFTRRQAFIPGLLPVLLTYIFILLTITKDRLIYPILGGVFFAMNAYTYPFHFLYMSSTIGILGFTLLVTGRIIELKRLIALGIASLIALIPFISNYLSVTSLAHYGEIFDRYGADPGRYFEFGNWKRYVASVVLSGFVLWWGRKTNNKLPSYLVVAALLSAVVVLNLQLVLGFSIHPDHWLNRSIIWAFTFGYFVLGVWFAKSYVLNKGRAWTIGLITIVLLVSASVTFNAVRSSVIFAEERANSYTLPTQMTELFLWLDENTERNSVVMTPSLVTNTYIPLFTHNKIYVPRALNTVAPDSELLERLFTTYSLFDIPPSYLRSVLESRDEADGVTVIEGSFDREDFYENSGAYYLFHLKYEREEHETYYERYAPPAELVDRIVSEYEAFTCDDSCRNKYRFDYVIVGDQERKIIDTDLSTLPFLEFTATIEGVDVYRYKN